MNDALQTLSARTPDVVSGEIPEQGMFPPNESSGPALLQTENISASLGARADAPCASERTPLGPAAMELQNENISAPAAQVESGEIPEQGLISRALSSAAALIPIPASRVSASDEYRTTEANRRLKVIQDFESLLAAGYSRRRACGELQESYTTIWRWLKRFAKHGFNGLLPDTQNCGRPTALEKLGITDAMIEDLRDKTRGLNLDTESGTAALRVYASSDDCPEPIANLILDPTRSSKHKVPPSLRRLVRVTDAERLAHRGPRALALNGIWTPRKMDVLPGDVFVADDTTPIYAWWTPWKTDEDHPFGVKLLQGQLLPVIDVASQCCLGYALIARDSASYRACDIWGLFGHVFDNVGLPRLGFQLERGSWEAQLIAGILVTSQEGECSFNRRVGGLRQLPTNVTNWHRERLAAGVEFPSTLQTWTSYLPKSKSIEAFFDRLQTLEGCMWGSLGRDQMRAPFEKAKKMYETCRRPRAKVDPREHFLSQTEIMSRLNEMIRWLNQEPMEGEVFNGIPAQKFEVAVRKNPLLQLPDEMKWMYAHDWRPATITRGLARVRLTDDLTGARYSLHYCNPRLFAAHEGDDVVIYYDRWNFERPAQIILARTGEFLCEAPYVDRKGSFLDGDRTGHDMRREWKDAVMSGYGTIVKHAPSRQLPPEIASRRQRSAAVCEAPAAEIGEPAAVTIRKQLPAPRPAPAILPGPTAEETARRRDLLARQAALARKRNRFDS